MSNLIHFLRQNQKFSTFFSHAMRPFAVLGMVFVLLGCLSFFVSEDFVRFHKFFFLNLAPAAIYGAFLLTALPDWLNFTKSTFKFSLFLFACLVFSLLFLAFSPQISAFFIFVFWASLGVFALILSWLDKNDKNISIIAVLFGFAGFELGFLLSGDEKFLDISLHAHCVAIAIISFRVSVALGYEALKDSGLKDPVFIPNAVHKNLQITFLTLLMASLLFDMPKVSGFVALGVGLVFLAMLKELHFTVLLRKYYVFSYYATILLGGISYVIYAFALLGGGFFAPSLHLIALCFMFGMIFLVLNIAGTRHSGLEMKIPKIGIFSVFVVFVSGILRYILEIKASSLYIVIPSIVLALATVIFSYKFIQIFISHEFSDDPE